MQRQYLPDVEYIASANGKPKAVILGLKDWERIAETLKIVSNKEFMASISRAKKQLKHNASLLTHQEVFGNL